MFYVSEHIAIGLVNRTKCQAVCLRSFAKGGYVLNVEDQLFQRLAFLLTL